MLPTRGSNFGRYVSYTVADPFRLGERGPNRIGCAPIVISPMVSLVQRGTLVDLKCALEMSSRHHNPHDSGPPTPMDLRHSPDLYNLDLEDRLPFNRFHYEFPSQDFSTSLATMLPTQQPATWDILGPFHQVPMPLPSIPPVVPIPSFSTAGGYPGASTLPTGFHPAQSRVSPLVWCGQWFDTSQATGLPYPESVIQTSIEGAPGRRELEENRRVYSGPTPRTLASQVVYKPPRRQKELGGSNVIDFSVRGERGICLSDALEGNWAGFVGRDDRDLFGDGPHRLVIMFRLHVGVFIVRT